MLCVISKCAVRNFEIGNVQCVNWKLEVNTALTLTGHHSIQHPCTTMCKTSSLFIITDNVNVHPLVC